ncbi:unnamed protein product [Closterium sp. NIES-54]
MEGSLGREGSLLRRVKSQGWVRSEGTAGVCKVIAFHSPDRTDANVTILITPLAADFTSLGSFGTVDAFAETLCWTNGDYCVTCCRLEGEMLAIVHLHTSSCITTHQHVSPRLSMHHHASACVTMHHYVPPHNTSPRLTTHHHTFPHITTHQHASPQLPLAPMPLATGAGTPHNTSPRITTRHHASPHISMHQLSYLSPACVLLLGLVHAGERPGPQLAAQSRAKGSFETFETSKNSPPIISVSSHPHASCCWCWYMQVNGLDRSWQPSPGQKAVLLGAKSDNGECHPHGGRTL